MERFLFRSSLAVIVSVVLAAPLGAAEADLHAPPSPRRAKIIDYTHRVMVAAYDTSPYRDPKWDVSARNALTFTAAMWSDDPRCTGDEENQIMGHARAAIDAGCEDPMVRFGLARAMQRLQGGWLYYEAIEHGNAAGLARKDTHYPPYIRAYIFLMGAWLEHDFGQSVDDPDWENHSKEWLERFLALLPDVFADKELPPELLVGFINHIGRVSKTIEGDRMVLVEKAVTLLEKSPQPKSVALAALGLQYVHYAWDARGVGLANTVTPKGWRLFNERIEHARQLLEQAWKLDPTNCDAATEMIGVVMANGGERKEMELWFERAMKLDAGNYTACSHKLLYLQPKWHGSFGEMLDFGRQLAKEGNWSGELPLILEDAHWTIAHNGPTANWPIPHTPYFKQPEVWRDLQPQYEAKLQRSPDSRRWRTRYMLVAAWAEKWDVAREQLEKLQNKPSSRVIGQAVEQVRKEIEAHTKQN